MLKSRILCEFLAQNLFFLTIFCRAVVIASHNVLCYVQYNYKYLYSVLLRHCSNKVVKLSGCCTHCLQCQTHLAVGGLVHNDVEQGVFYYNQHVSTLFWNAFFLGGRSKKTQGIGINVRQVSDLCKW